MTLETELERAYAEIRKQVAGSGVVFDREVCERAAQDQPFRHCYNTHCVSGPYHAGECNLRMP